MQYVKVWIAHYSQSVSALCGYSSQDVKCYVAASAGPVLGLTLRNSLVPAFLPFLFQSTLSRVRGKMYFVLTFTLAPFDVQKIYANMFQSVYKL